MIHALKTNRFTLFLSPSLLTLFPTLQSSTCSKNDDIIANTTGTPTGTWRVTLYWDSGDETNKFAGYNFTFNSGGTVTATNGVTTVNGTWSESSSRMTLDFGTDPLFRKISDDYLKEEKTATSIRLKDDNPLKDEKVQFARN